MIEPVLAALKGQRFPLEDEKATQAAIDDVLKAASLAVEREVPLGKGFIDFVVTLSVPERRQPFGMAFRRVGIEVKIKGAPREIIRQVRSYAAEKRLDAIILVTAKPVALQSKHDGTPLHVFDISRAWL